MKGVVFTEFIDMAEERFGLAAVDRAILDSDLPSGGTYTSVGTYDHFELLQLVRHLSESTGKGVPELVREFGRHLFKRFVEMYPVFFVDVHTAFDVFENIEKYIHPEVRKLYPDAELPRFEQLIRTTDRMEFVYRSSRPFADLAEGLIIGCAEHFGERIDIKRTVLPANGTPAVRFSLTQT